MARFGWHSGKVLATSYEFAKNTSSKYGLDLSNLTPSNADVKLTNDVCILTGAGTPTDDNTGNDVAGPGSLYVDVTNSNHYINAGTKASTVWKLVTRAA